MMDFTFETASKLIGCQVTLSDSAENTVPLLVAEVARTAIDGDEWEGFEVVFTGDESFRVPQGTYRLSHESFTSGEVFLTAHGPTEYQTVISRRR
ncbi:MAG: hypothetical protein VW258_01240 [Thalassolituus sp.]